MSRSKILTLSLITTSILASAEMAMAQTERTPVPCPSTAPVSRLLNEHDAALQVVNEPITIEAHMNEVPLFKQGNAYRSLYLHISKENRRRISAGRELKVSQLGFYPSTTLSEVDLVMEDKTVESVVVQFENNPNEPLVSDLVAGVQDRFKLVCYEKYIEEASLDRTRGASRW